MEMVIPWQLCRTIGPLHSQRFLLGSAKAQPSGEFVFSLPVIIVCRIYSFQHGTKCRPANLEYTTDEEQPRQCSDCGSTEVFIAFYLKTYLFAEVVEVLYLYFYSESLEQIRQYY